MSLAQRLLRPVTKKRGLAYALGLFSGVTGLTTWNFRRNAALVEEKVNQAVENLKDFTPTEIWGQNAVFYPWVDNFNNWEYKLVKMRGYFETERVFVRKEKDGKVGFLVFAPFVTAHILSRNHELVETNPEASKNGIMVNLGWVPNEHVAEIQAGKEPLPLLEFEDLANDFVDPHTGFTYKTIYNEEFEERPPYTEVTGLLRKGEDYNIALGQTQGIHNKRGNINYIDLPGMSRFARFINEENTSTAYLERIVPSLDEEDQSVYPIPATPTSFTNVTLDQDKYRSLATFTGSLSAIGLGLIVPLLVL